MKLGNRPYMIGDGDPTGWDEVPSVPRDTTLRRKALVAIVASGCSRSHAAAALGVSLPTLSRDMQALEQASPGFGSDEWALAHYEREATRLRRKLSRDDSADEAMGN